MESFCSVFVVSFFFFQKKNIYIYISSMFMYMYLILVFDKKKNIWCFIHTYMTPVCWVAVSDWLIWFAVPSPGGQLETGLWGWPHSGRHWGVGDGPTAASEPDWGHLAVLHRRKLCTLSYRVVWRIFKRYEIIFNVITGSYLNVITGTCTDILSWNYLLCSLFQIGKTIFFSSKFKWENQCIPKKHSNAIVNFITSDIKTWACSYTTVILHVCPLQVCTIRYCSLLKCKWVQIKHW